MRLERRCLFNVLALGCSLLLPLALPTVASGAPTPAFVQDERYASIVVDADSGRVLMATHADQIVHPASLTKIMTLYMTFDALKRGEIRLQQSHTVSSHAASMTPSKLGLRPGDTITTDQAILALVTKSANDAAVVLAEALSGTESEFGWAMTQRARALGMASTAFANASGLPDMNQVTSARDMAVLALALLRDHPRYYRYFATQEFIFRGQVHHNHNRLLGSYDGIDGIKTGFINASGFNLVASAQRDGRRLIGVVFGGSTSRTRDAHMASLLDDGFRSLGVDPAPQYQPPQHASPLVRVADQKAKPVAESKSKTKVKSKGPSAEELERQAIEADGGRGWSVQIGVFKTRDLAERANADALRRVPKHTSMAAADVSQVKTAEGRRYRARLQHLSAVQAKAICEELKKQKHACQPMGPANGKSATMASVDPAPATRTN